MLGPTVVSSSLLWLEEESSAVELDSVVVLVNRVGVPVVFIHSTPAAQRP